MLVLRLKLVLYVLVAVALASAAAMKLALDGQYAAACAQATQLHSDGVRELAKELSPGLVEDDAAKMTGVLRGRLGEEDWLQVTVLDGWGEVMLREPASARRDDQGAAAYVPGLLGGWHGLDPLLRMVFPQPELEVAIESASGVRVGSARVRLSAGDAGATVMGVARTWLTASVGMLLLIGLATYGGAAGVVVPLRHIQQAIRVMTTGEEARVPLKGTSELVSLARGVNDLAGRLSEMTARLTLLSAKTTFISDVVQSMADTLIVVDQQARIKTVNRATVELLGFTERELVGRTASLICMTDGKHLTAEALEGLLGQGSKRDHEVTYFAKDGRRVPISLSGSAIRDAQGKSAGYVCIGTDISDRKQAEAEREQLNKKLVQTSRQAGMAEVATGVLHNVGNVLNSVNVSAAMVEEMLRKSRVAQVRQLAELLGEHAQDLGAFMTGDERGRMVPGYLSQLSRHLAEEQQRAISELGQLSKHIGHIKDIISVQQSIAKTAGVIEPVDLGELVEDALRMIGESIEKHGVRVEREIGEVGVVNTDKHKVLQILVNLLTNAKDAVKECPDRGGVLTVRLAARGGGDGGGEADGGAGGGAPAGVTLEVTDNGVGIEAQNLTRVFTHGFTTKKKGHGFGLHASALAAKELGGSLTARSAGPGTGATFVLELPAKPAAAEAQAR